MASLNQSQLEKLFSMASLEMPAEVDENMISKALVEIEKKIMPVNAENSISNFTEAPSILIVDDLELSIHQLSLLLTKSGYNVNVARSVVEAADLFKKRHYQYVLLDLFMPDSQDGLNLLSEFHSLEKSKNDNTKFIIISGTDDKKLIRECFVKGADEFVEKSSIWHKKILGYIGFLEKQKSGANEEVIANIEDEEKKIAAISVINIHKDTVIQALDKEVSYLINSGYSNIVIDLENLYSINSKGISALIANYKVITEAGGDLALCNIKNSVNEVLSYVFLHNVLKIYSDRAEAVNSFKKSAV